MQTRKRARQSGHSLIEMMIALGVFSVGVLGLVPLLITGTNGVTTATKFGHATALAQAKLEELQRLQFTSDELTAGAHDDNAMNIGPSGTPYKPDGTETSEIGEADGWFARRWTITDEDINDQRLGADWKHIEVEVSWIDFGASRRVVISGGKAALE